MSGTMNLSPADIINIGSEVAGFIMFREWNAPPSETVGIVRIALDDETIHALADEIASRLV